MMETNGDNQGVLHSLLDRPYIRMLRITAYVYRVIRRIRDNQPLSTEEIKNAEKYWIKYAQRGLNPNDEQNILKNDDDIYLISGRIRDIIQY